MTVSSSTANTGDAIETFSTGWSPELSAGLWNLTHENVGVNIGAARAEFTGAGVRIAVIDDGFDYNHGEMSATYDRTLDRDFRDNDQDAFSSAAGDNHGTAVMGVIGAAANGLGMVGVAHQADLVGVRIGFGPAWTAAAGTNAMSYSAGLADVVNASWGMSSPFADNSKKSLYASMDSAFASAVANGRGGLGANIVFAGGNSRAEGGNVNYHNYRNDVDVIAVASTNAAGDVSAFSSPGAALLVAAPGSGVMSTDRLGAAGYTTTDFTTISGTSFAAPTVSGVIGLMLEANPLLGYRDVQDILALTARMSGTKNEWQTNGATGWNGGGMHFSHDVGFGLVDGSAAVRLAESWTKTQVAGNLVKTTASVTTPVALRDNGVLESSVTISTKRIDHIERIAVELNIAHARVSDLVVTLTSPSGAVATLVARPSSGSDATGLVFGMTANTFRGESEVGAWTLTVRDQVAGVVGTLRSWSMTMLGDQDTADDLYVYTNAFATLWTAARSTVSDVDGGVDTLNFAALTRAVDLNLAAGATSAVAGKALEIAQGTAIENAHLGAGDDKAMGNALANAIDGDRGGDTLSGGAGADTLTGGRGADRLEGGADQDVFVYRAALEGGDTIVDFNRAHGDRLDLTRLLASVGLTGASAVETAVAQGVLTLRSGPTGAVLAFDRDGAGAGAGVDLVALRGISSNTRILDLVSGARVDARTAPDDPGSTGTVFVLDDRFATAWTSEASRLNDTALETLDARALTLSATLSLAGGAGRIGAKAIALSPGVAFKDAHLGAGADRVTGSNADNMIDGGAGRDTLFGLGGSDRLVGGAGDDSLSGGDGADTLAGGADRDALDGGRGADLLMGDDGADRLEGGADADTLTGGSGADNLMGGDGADRLEGGAENDALMGDADADALFGGDGADRLVGGAGADALWGDGGDDQLWGGASADTLNGGAGRDVLWGDMDGDVLSGGEGADDLHGGQGDDVLNGGAGVDLLVGGLGSDTFVAGADAADRVMDFSARDGDVFDFAPLLGGSSASLASLFGSGHLTLREGHRGAWVVVDQDGRGSGVGVDTFFLAGHTIANVDLFDAGAGAATIYRYADAFFSGLGAGTSVLNDVNGGIDTMDFSRVSSAVALDLNAGRTSTVGSSKIMLGPTSVVENARLGSGADSALGNGSANRLEGGAGHDTLNGGLGDDVLVGGIGSDRFVGGAGADVFVLGTRAEGVDLVADFSLRARDKLDVSGLLAEFSVSRVEAIADGLFALRAGLGGSMLTFDADGIDGGAAFDVAFLQGVRSAPAPSDAWFA